MFIYTKSNTASKPSRVVWGLTDVTEPTLWRRGVGFRCAELVPDRRDRLLAAAGRRGLRWPNLSRAQLHSLDISATKGCHYSYDHRSRAAGGSHWEWMGNAVFSLQRLIWCDPNLMVVSMIEGRTAVVSWTSPCSVFSTFSKRPRCDWA